MSLISKLTELLPDDADIIIEEYKTFMFNMKQYSEHKKYYVYWLCAPNGVPFYIGKGTGKRAWSHLLEYTKRRGDVNKSNKELGIEHLISDLKEYPIVYIFKDGLTESEALKHEAEQIAYYGRFSQGGILTNIMPGGALTDPKGMASSYGGKIGGRTTKDSNKGIFDPNYDRSAQSKKNWELGLLDHVDFSIVGAKGGASCVANGSGMFREDLQHLRSEWAKLGAASLAEQGTRGGCCTSGWWSIPENRESAIATARLAGKIGGKTTGSKPWWNDGVKNKRSHECPGPGYVKGMIPSEKKLKQLADGRETQRKNLEAKRLAAK